MKQVIIRNESGKLTKGSYNTLIAMAQQSGYKNGMPKYPKNLDNQSAWVGYNGRFKNWYNGLVMAMQTAEEVDMNA